MQPRALVSLSLLSSPCAFEPFLVPVTHYFRGFQMRNLLVMNNQSRPLVCIPQIWSRNAPHIHGSLPPIRSMMAQEVNGSSFRLSLFPMTLDIDWCKQMIKLSQSRQNRPSPRPHSLSHPPQALVLTQYWLTAPPISAALPCDSLDRVRNSRMA